MPEIGPEQIKALQEMYAPEELHPDLVPYLNAHDRIGQVLQHPLVYNVPHHTAMNRMVNRQYVEKLRIRDRARDIGDWSQYIWIHERPYRFDAFSEINEELDDVSYWQLLASIWTDSENIVQNYADWTALWSSDRPQRENTMDADDQEALQALPEILTIYRGYGHQNAVNGLSWTLDKTRGEWFARRYSAMDGRKPHLARGTVEKRHVLAHFNGRNESEIVVIPENVMIKKVTILRQKVK